MSETGATDEQVNEATIAFIDEWNSTINPRTGRRYRAGSWSTRLWFQYMRAALNAVIKPGYVIVPAGAVVLTAEETVIARVACYVVAALTDAKNQPDDAEIYRALAAKLGGAS